jgi:hypothetical protein
MTIAAFLTGQTQLGHFPFNVVQIYHHHTSDTEICQGRDPLFVPGKDVKHGSEVSSANMGVLSYHSGA